MSMYISTKRGKGTAHKKNTYFPHFNFFDLSIYSLYTFSLLEIPLGCERYIKQKSDYNNIVGRYTNKPNISEVLIFT